MARTAGLRRLSLMAATVVLASILVPFLPATPAEASPNTFVTMSDGIEIAVNIRMPKGYQKGQSYPTIFEMSGYDGGASDGDEPYAGLGSRVLTEQFKREYVTVHASVRGTGCSGGEFDLFSWRSALDGREIIAWIDQQPWSNGRIGIYGHSYGGITGFMVASTRPPELDAVSVSGLIDDIYRGIVYPGGVSNYGFPLLWTGGVRNVYDIGGGFLLGMDEGGAEKGCVKNAPTKSRTVLNDPILQGIQDTDNTWFQARSLINYAERIEVPIHISGAYQDEQTGPRGPYHLFEEVVNAPVRRLLMTNGDHGTQQDQKFFEPDRKKFLDHYLIEGGKSTVSGVCVLGRRCRSERTYSEYPPSSVITFLENLQGQEDVPVAIENETFPLENTKWTNVYFGPDGSLLRKPERKGGGNSYFSGSPRQSWSYQAGHSSGSPFTTEDANGVDELVFSTKKFDKPTAIIGPATATLFMSSTAPDTEMFVQVIDEAPDGSRYFVQRGLLKASHRAIMPGLSDRLEDGRIYRPHRPHTNPQLIQPGSIYKYLVEIFPFGHVFRPGHKMIVKVHTPPAVDSYYAYIPKRPAGVNTLYHGGKTPSSLMLPFVPINGVRLKPEPKPCTLEDIRCVR